MSINKISLTNVTCGALLILGSASANATMQTVTGGTLQIHYDTSIAGVAAGYGGFFSDQVVSGGDNDGLSYAELPNGTAIVGAARGTNGSVMLHTDAIASINVGTVINPGTRALIATDFQYDDSLTNLTDFASSAMGKIGTTGASFMTSNTVSGDFFLDSTSLDGTAETWQTVNQIDFTGFAAFDLTDLVLASNSAGGFTITGKTTLNTNLAAFFGMNAGDYVGDFTLNATVSAVPVPAAVWLFGSALGGLFVSSKKKGLAKISA